MEFILSDLASAAELGVFQARRGLCQGGPVVEEDFRGDSLDALVGALSA